MGLPEIAERRDPHISADGGLSQARSDLILFVIHEATLLVLVDRVFFL